jgi:hypothetical protein
MGVAGNRAFENSVVRVVYGYGIYRDHGNDDLSDLSHQLEMSDDLVFLPLKPAEDFGDLSHDGRRNQQSKSSFSRWRHA